MTRYSIPIAFKKLKASSPRAFLISLIVNYLYFIGHNIGFRLRHCLCLLQSKLFVSGKVYSFFIYKKAHCFLVEVC